jgi:hypothetical protein
MKTVRPIALATLALIALATGEQLRSASAGRVVLVDRPFRCGDYPQPLDLELVKVTLGPGFTGKVNDAVNLNRGDCSGRIGRVEVDTWIADGVKIGASAHDLVIEGGYIYCHEHRPGNHQDAVQAMGGVRLTLRNLHVYCPSSNNASLFVGGDGRGGVPTDVVCENCQLDGGGQTVFIARSIRSGVRDSLVRAGRHRAIRVGEATDPVLEGIVKLPCAASCRQRSGRSDQPAETGSLDRSATSSLRG